jgi:hypothetical protein
MDRPPSDEPQHAFGMKLEQRHSLPRVDPTEQRVLGIPLSWYSIKSADLSWMRNPIRWTKWRVTAHRRGPYAPSYEEFLARSEKP